MTAIRFTTCAVLIAIAICGCSNNNQQGNPVTLPSGRVIRVLSLTPMHYVNGSPPSLMLRYQTDLKVSDKDALRKEADDIWTKLRFDAEQGNFSSAIISANEIPRGFILKNSSGYNFAYEKRADGTWHCLDDDQSGSK